jgi:hypothetical protein
MAAKRSFVATWIEGIMVCLPERIDALVRRIDAFLGGTGTIPWFYGRSLLAFLLPVPVYLFIVYGPSLAKSPAGQLAWRGGYTAAGLVAGALLIQLIYFLQDRGRCMAWVHFCLTSALAFLAWVLAAPESHQASANLYRHYYGLLAFGTMLVAVPVAAGLRHRSLFALPAKALEAFHTAFIAAKVAAPPQRQEYDDWAVIGAYLLALLRKPLHVAAPVALVVLLVPPAHLPLWTTIALAVSLILFATSIFNPDLDAFVRLFQHIFLTGGTLVVTLAVIVLAIMRLAGIDYITTVLDNGSNLTLLSYLVSTYTLFWLYDFWIDQAILDLVIKANGFASETTAIQRHGGGRLAVIAETPDGIEQRRMFDPTAFLMRIVQTAAESSREPLRREARHLIQRFRVFAIFCLAIYTLLLVLVGVYLHTLDPAPGLAAANKDTPAFNLAESLLASPRGPVILLAASGGGTRAALYTTAVLHALARLGRIDRLALVSGVSGGSAALAYFAMRRPSLARGDDKAWVEMRETLASPFIDDVLAGAAEYRIVSRYRLGQLLTESFTRRFLAAPLGGLERRRVCFGAIQDVGLIFNTSLCGVAAAGYASDHAAPTERRVGRLVITNLVSDFDRKSVAAACGLGIDLPYEIVHDPAASLFAAASLSANFPPVFSNAAVDAGGNRFWVTDGGAVENRGVLSLLLVLNETLESILGDLPGRDKGRELADIRIVIADASAYQPQYKSDRGLAAKFGASEQIANRLIVELVRRAKRLHQLISRRQDGIRVTYLPMPDAMRAAGTFGTHWMMPGRVVLKDPSSQAEGIELTGNEINALMDAMFAREYSVRYIADRWPHLDAPRIMALTDKPFDILETCLQ